MRRRLLRIALVLSVVAIAPPAALADYDGKGGGKDNIVVVENDRDGSDAYRANLKITRVSGDRVENVNLAAAIASCVDCRTRAIALQIVLVTGNPSVVTPANAAVAINDRCSECVTFAYAYQGVFATGGKAEFTDEGEERIEDVREELEELEDSSLSPDALDARLDELVLELKDIVKTDLVVKGTKSEDIESDDDPESDDDDDEATEGYVELDD